jgi:NAD(P)-dependent dehydrogenase (short-subunit alcohol dehydrogenase family)
MAGILDGKVAIITGAGSGIGRATSLIFAREGAKILLADVQEEGGNETLKLVKEAGASAVFMRVDVAKWSDVEAMVAKAVESYGRLDCAFNNAGIDGRGGRIHECTEENWNRVISINLTGVWLCMKAEVTQMLKQGGGGSIVNTSSIAGITGGAGLPAYIAAKHGVAGLTRAGALEYGLPGTDSYANARQAAQTKHRGRGETFACGAAQALGRAKRDWRNRGMA